MNSLEVLFNLVEVCLVMVQGPHAYDLVEHTMRLTQRYLLNWVVVHVGSAIAHDLASERAKGRIEDWLVTLDLYRRWFVFARLPVVVLRLVTAGDTLHSLALVQPSVLYVHEEIVKHLHLPLVKVVRWQQEWLIVRQFVEGNVLLHVLQLGFGVVSWPAQEAMLGLLVGDFQIGGVSYHVGARVFDRGNLDAVVERVLEGGDEAGSQLAFEQER